ncbi:MAG TPA: tRNA 2-thiouridine(34) synthase MnmA, partial [Rhodospirillaceae bacterium]|nr:tRNA 2-thiouridine(34) synthase MnmA [Rhodospirillaceae bacterium]
MSFTENLSGKRIAVALSGGVDSAVVAALLKEQGAEIVGLTMRVQETDDMQEATQLAQWLRLEHYIIDLTARFKSCVMDAFADSYLRGETPSPCVHCNRHLKFGSLMEAAKEKGCVALATGHYARRRESPSGGAELHQAIDPLRDQSYFLFSLSPEQINFLRFPLGDKTKKEVRALAQERGIPSADKKDSQDICFVP